MKWLWRKWKAFFCLKEVEHYLTFEDHKGVIFGISYRETFHNSTTREEIEYMHQAWLRQQYSMYKLYPFHVQSAWEYID